MGKICSIDEDIMLYEGIEIEKHHVERGSLLENRSIEELDLEEQIGCTIVGIKRGKLVITIIERQTIIRAGDTIAVVGSSKQISEFKERYIG
ncbi:cation:proton antiporter regulatory subunit [Methanosarcina sp. UBA411]|uniref:cation:proton antiporter regulatory subunit n=1 Tax=Methanosarcina sp. UBA411 TaxID=1915589 RepID=UPI0025FDA46E|nr:TrkA C-terminal domain-containing protein [Methanosarcina sp. UBA411]